MGEVEESGVFWVEDKNLCIFLEEDIEGIGKIKFIKDFISFVLEFGFDIKLKENFKDRVIKYTGIYWKYLGWYVVFLGKIMFLFWLIRWTIVLVIGIVNLKVNGWWWV